MSPPPAAPLDIAERAPTALELADLRPAVPVVAVDPWDHTTWLGHVEGEALARGFLPAISRLAEAWRPVWDAEGQPGKDLIDRAQGLWPVGSYEREYFEKALDAARAMDPRIFVKNEREVLRKERRRARDPEAASFYDLLLAVVQELERIRKSRDHVVATGGDPRFTQWILVNVEEFLHAHWAMQRVHESVVELLEHRRKAAARLAGSIELDGLSADEHGDVA